MYVALSRCKTLNGIHTMGTLQRNELLYSQAVKDFMATTTQEADLKVPQILEEIKRRKIDNVRAYANKAKSQQTQLNNVLSQIRNAERKVSQSNTTDVIRPLVKFINEEKENVANYYKEVDGILKKARNEAIGYEQEEGMANLLAGIKGVLNQIRLIDAEINIISEDADRTLKKVQQQEEYNRKINKIKDCRNELTTIATSTHNTLAIILEARSQFSANNKSIAIQPHVDAIKKDSANVKNYYTRGDRLLQTAKREAAGFNRDDEMAQLIGEISDILKQISEDNVAAQRIVSDASLVLKSVQKKERKKKLSIAIGILAIAVTILAILYNM